jgi:dihydrofolate reductase
MTMSLDGFVSDAEARTNLLSSGLANWRHTGRGRASIAATGAVLMGRNTFEMAADPDSYASQYEYQVPIFVLTSRPPKRRPKENSALTFSFVTDGLESALTKAVSAAGDKQVTVVGGATLIQALLRSGRVDELDIDLMPVLLHGGLRLLDHLTTTVALERIDLEALPGGGTALRYAVRHATIG